jgi:DNA-binding NarL/FixJ family response regulator
MGIIKIAVVDDHKLFREGLVSLLSKSHDQFKVVWEACDGKKFLEKLQIEFPDIVLMDISMPEMDGIEATTAAIARYPEIRK